VTLPKNCTGHRIVVEGVLVDTNQEKEQGHECPGKEEGGDHRCPQPNYVLSMEAVELMGPSSS
jgi:hypothetical protein